MKYFLIVFLFAICNFINAQKTVLTTDTTIVIPAIHFDANGELNITASSTSSDTDFNFLVGKWKMYHRRLNTADMDMYSTTQMPGMNGKLFEGVTFRLFNPQTKLWSLYWVASNRGVLDPPMVGSFENNIGHFFAKDTFKGKPIIVVFRWDVRNKNKPVWSRAFSADNGKTWEWNWYNVSERVN